MIRHLRVLPDLDALSAEAAEIMARAIGQRTGDSFAIALSGGNTPRGAYELLARNHRDTLRWEHVHFFWGDERYVPHDSPQSNYLMARRAMLDALPIPEGNIHPVPTAMDDPERSALRYEAALREHFGGDIPRFDLSLLGIGDDGHTASLFPGSPALDERSRLAVVTQAPVEPVTRISLTFPVLNAARLTLVLAAGESKRPIIREIFDEPERAREHYPAARLAPGGEIIWLVDAAAGAR